MHLAKSYLILSYDNLDELTQEVNVKWVEGWRPQGGLTAVPTTTGSVFLQALIREEENVMINIAPHQRALVEQNHR